MADFVGQTYKLESVDGGFSDFDEAVKASILQEDLHTYKLVKGEGENEYTQTRHFGNNFLQALWLMDYGDFTFKSGEQFTHRDLSGSDQQSTIEVTGDTVTQVQVLPGLDGGNVEVKTVRTFSTDGQTVVFSSTATDLTVTVTLVNA